MQEYQVDSLIHFKLEELCKAHRKFRIKWKKEDRCECIKDLQEEQLPNCNHVRKAINRKFKKETKKIWGLTMYNYEKKMDKIFSKDL